MAREGAIMGQCMGMGKATCYNPEYKETQFCMSCLLKVKEGKEIELCNALQRYKKAVEAIEGLTHPNEGEEIDNIVRIAGFCNWVTGKLKGEFSETTTGPVIITEDVEDRTNGKS